MIIDLSLSNTGLYQGCQIETDAAGRATLVTPHAEAMNLIGANLGRMLSDDDHGSACTLTGIVPVWTHIYGCDDVHSFCFPYVFRAVCSKFSSVYYDDGRGTKSLIYAK